MFNSRFAHKYSLLFLSAMTAIALNVNAASVDNYNVGLAYTPVLSVPGAKVRTTGNIEYLLLELQSINNITGLSVDAAISNIENNTVDAWFGVLPEGLNLPDNIKVKDLNWSASPMVIMRSDTDISSWDDIRGRSVCISKDSRYVGELGSRFGAVEDIYPTVTDALLALRIGQCDATLQEEDFVKQLLEYPEWQKFSASLQPYKQVNLVGMQLAENNELQSLFSLFAVDEVKEAVKQQARDIAFEVYLDQTVPDCH